MSKDVDRNQVFQTTRVRTPLKNDVSWIQKSKQENNEHNNARTDQDVETRPVPVRQNSYVLSTARKFESVDSPLSPSLQNTQFVPSEGFSDSANQANGEVIPPQKDAQPEGSTVETTDNTKSQAPTEELNPNCEAQPEKSVANTTAENKEEHADTTVVQSNNEGAAEVSADVHVEERIQNGEAQPVSSTMKNPEAVSPVEPTELPVVNTAAENKEEYADTAVDQSNVAHTEVSADAHVEGSVAETSIAAGTQESKDSTEVPTELAVKPKPQEEPCSRTDGGNATNLEDAGVQSTVEHAEGSCEKCPPQQAAVEVVEAVADAVVESSPDKSDVSNATQGEEAAVQNNVEPVPDLLAESVSASPTQPAAESATVESCEKGPPEEAAEETVKAVDEVNVEPPPEAAADAAGEEATLQDNMEPAPDIVADTVSGTSTQPAPETPIKSAECKVESAASAEPVLQTRAEEAVKCEVQPVVEQSVEPTPESAADPVTASDAEADKLPSRTIALTDALDLEPPTTKAAPEPLKEPEQSHTEEMNQLSDHTNNSEMIQKPTEELRSTQTLEEPRDIKSLCTFCDKIIDGNVRIMFSEPLLICHPDCLKCGVCAKVLGDLLTPLFLHNQVILCDGCFATTLKT